MNKFLLSLLSSAILLIPAAMAMDEADKLENFKTVPQIEFTPIEREPQTHPQQLLAIKNISASKDIIHQCLADVKKAELHFFWTTGRTLSKNNDYNPDTHVNVGGVEYGQDFFPCVDSLLKNSPNHLKINFVCDSLTYDSYKVSIFVLKQRYKERFEILDINDVTKHLLQNFPTFNDKINTVFKNATQGNPVLASDIYRIIGMIYGKPMPLDLDHAQHTYCDVDTFCHGMQHKTQKHHIKLIESLFQKPSLKEKFYFGRRINNNDLIKISIDDLSSYKEFCERMLNKLNLEEKIFTYFSDLHNIITLSETNAEQGFNMCLNFKPMPFGSIMPNTNGNFDDLRYSITRATGPLFVREDEGITYDINEYPAITAGEWWKHERDSFLRETQSAYFPGDNKDLEEKIKFAAIFVDYKHLISLAMYAKRFGENHPFNVKIKEHLKENFPYASGAFKNYLEDHYTYYHNKEGKNYSEWRKFLYNYWTGGKKYFSGGYDLNTFGSETHVFNTHFANLMNDLKSLGVKIPFTEKHLDWNTNLSELDEPEFEVPLVNKLLSRIDHNDLNSISSELEQHHDSSKEDVLKACALTILCAAIEKGNVPIIETLLGTKKIDWSTVDWSTALHSDINKAYNGLNAAIQNKNIELVKTLLAFAEMKWQTESSTVPNILASAIETADPEMVNLVLFIKNNWAQPQFFAWGYEDNILVKAVDSKKPEIIKSILSIEGINWSNPNFLKDSGRFPLLCIADQMKDLEIMNALFWNDIIDWSSPEVTKGLHGVEHALSLQMSELLAQSRAKREVR